MLSFLEVIAKRLNMPIGGLLCLLLVAVGLYTAIFEPYLLNRTNDVLIGAGLWGFAFIACWVGYGEEFWMSPKLALEGPAIRCEVFACLGRPGGWGSHFEGCPPGFWTEGSRKGSSGGG